MSSNQSPVLKKCIVIVIIFSLLILISGCKNIDKRTNEHSEFDHNKIRNLVQQQFNKLDTVNSDATMWALARYVNADLPYWNGQDTALAVLVNFSLIYPQHESLKYLSVSPPSRELIELASEIYPKSLDTSEFSSYYLFFDTRMKIGNYILIE